MLDLRRSGTISRTIWLEANGIKYGFQEKYLRRIADLPEARLFVGPENTKEARFDFTGGRAICQDRWQSP